jgi:Flp pilus assembly protein TadG
MANRRSDSSRTSPSRGERRRGAAMVEFSLGFLLFLSLLVGVFEGARLVWTYATLAHSVREGARFAAVRGHWESASDTAIAELAKSRAVGLNPADLSISTAREPGPRTGTNMVRIEGDYPLPLVASHLVFGRDSIRLRYVARATVAE